jgi:hypothetical protein
MDDQPLDEPWVRALVVAGAAPGTLAAHVLIAWDDLAAIGEVAAQTLPSVIAGMAAEPSFGGEICFVLPDEFVPNTKRNRAALAAIRDRLAAAAAGQVTASGAPIVPEIRIESTGGPPR